MDPVGEMSSGCEDGDWGVPDDCSNQDSHMEEPMFGLSELVCVTVVYVPLMLFGLVGNVLTILVVWLRPHMRSSTYLYLSSMAVSDLLILLLLPLDLYKLWRPRPWPFGDLACKLTMFLSECCTFCTILHITFLSLERYVAVCWPITAKTLVTRRRTRAVIGCLWLGAAVSAAPVLVMVGAEDVGGEEHRLAHWREDGGRTGWEAEQGRLLAGGRDRGHVALLDGGTEGARWEGKENKGWGESFGGKEDGQIVDIVEDGGENQAGEEVGKKPEGVQRNKKEDDEGGGGGKEGSTHGGHPARIDLRECRCTDYAVSSGLLSAMMIVSNLYFLIPLCVLGLVYSLIGRTLCLRPKSSRKDQSHRHTVRMLGVIVLAFVLCWLPFHVGRTIFSLSMGVGADQQEAYPDFSSDWEVTTRSDLAVNTGNPPADASARSAGYPDTNSSEALARTLDGDDVINDVCSTTERLKTHSTHDRLIETNALPETRNDYSASGRKPDHTGANATPLDPIGNVTGFNGTHWLPDPHAYFLYYLSQYFNLVSSVLFYLSAAVNPLLYNLMSARYRLAVHSLVHARAPAQRLAARHSMTTTTL